MNINYHHQLQIQLYLANDPYLPPLQASYSPSPTCWRCFQGSHFHHNQAVPCHPFFRNPVARILQPFDQISLSKTCQQLFHRQQVQSALDYFRKTLYSSLLICFSLSQDLLNKHWLFFSFNNKKYSIFVHDLINF